MNYQQECIIITLTIQDSISEILKQCHMNVLLSTEVKTGDMGLNHFSWIE